MQISKFYLLPIVSILSLFSGCVSPVVVDYEQSALPQFSKYRCYTIDSRDERISYQDVALSPIVDRRITRALHAVLLAKGYRSDCPEADFRVTFMTSSQTRTVMHDLSAGPPPFRRHPYFGSIGYSHISIDQYEEGTLVVDVIDNVSQQLVWRGAHTARLAREARNDSEIHKIISEVLEDFPPVLLANSD